MISRTGVDHGSAAAIIDCGRAVLSDIESHVATDTAREVGGILVGRSESGRLTVEAALPALRAVGSSANVTFTHEVWEEILPRVDVEWPDSKIVGWYHSHPGFGIFLSEYDRFIHANFFPAPEMVALVVDPKAGQAGWFIWRDGSIELAEEFPTLRPAEANPSQAAASRGGSRGRITAALVVAASIIVGVGIGYLAADGPRTEPSPALAQARAGAAQARQQTAALQRQLDQSRAAQAAVVAPTTKPATIGYRVRGGDTIWSLAASLYESGFDNTRIIAANPGVDPNRLAVGQTLQIPVGP